MTSQWVERTWIRTGGSGANGLIVILQTSYITFFSFLPKLKPGVPFSTTRVEIPLGPDKMNEVRRGKLILL